MGLCAFSLPISLMMILRICVLYVISLMMIVKICVFYLIIIIKLEVWPICHCLGLVMKQWFTLYVFWYSFKSLSPRQNGHNFADDIIKCILLNENVSILIKILLKFIHKGPIDNIPTLVQIMAWHQPGANHYLNQWLWAYWSIYIYHSTSISQHIIIWKDCSDSKRDFECKIISCSLHLFTFL